MITAEQKAELKSKFDNLYSSLDQINDILDKKDKKDSPTYKKVTNFFEKKKHILNSFQATKYYIAFVGSYSTGKSTFINALLNRDLLPEKLEEATTAFPTYVHAVSSSSTEKAEIVYLTSDEREKLKNFYLEIIADKTEMDQDELLEQTIEEVLENIANWKTEYPNEQKHFDNLKRLIEKWNEKIGDTEEVDIESVKDYVENNENAIIIKRADIYLKNSLFANREDIVLLDLPGVDAHNPRHYQTTHKLTIEEGKTHAYVVLSAPEKIDSDKTNEYLKELSKHSTHLSKAFWVINRCDLIAVEKVEDTKKAFVKNNSKLGINTQNDRVFTASAKLYKDQKLGTKSSPAQEFLIDQVDELRSNLAEYIESAFEKELFDTNENEYQTLKRKLMEFLNPYVERYIALKNESEGLLEIALVDSKLHDWKSSLQNNINALSKKINDQIQNLNFFDEDTIQKLKNRIDNSMEESAKSENNKINLPDDIHEPNPETMIRELGNSVPLNHYIREEFEYSLQEGGLRNLKTSFTLLGNNDDLDHFFIDKFKEIDTTFSLQGRFQGICDILLMKYYTVFDNLLPLLVRNDDNNWRSFLTVQAKEKFEEEVTITLDKKPVAKSLIQWILDSETNDETFEEIAKTLDISVTDEDYQNSFDYVQEILKQKMYVYLDKITEKVNSYVKICLTNYFRTIFSKVRQVITDNQDLDSKVRYFLHQRAKDDKGEIMQEKDKKQQLFDIHEKIKNDYQSGN